MLRHNGISNVNALEFPVHIHVYISMVNRSKRYANPLKFDHSWCGVLFNETCDLCDGNAK